MVGEQLLSALSTRPSGVPPRVLATMESSSFIPTGLLVQAYGHPAFKSAVSEISRARHLKPVLH